jgi:hypothetical protein
MLAENVFIAEELRQFNYSYWNLSVADLFVVLALLLRNLNYTAAYNTGL